ncbi:MAG: helix-turn-helix domain-containing protein [Planctomycetes bacterium]|nr:helix-turn-helix domain-containing protein [Planctomycetota bacterium]
MAERLLDLVSVATRLGVTRGDIARMVREGTLPHIALPNGEVRFDPGELSSWIESRRRPVKPALKGGPADGD